jgi:hypothetical protein
MFIYIINYLVKMTAFFVLINFFRILSSEYPSMVLELPGDYNHKSWKKKVTGN